MSEQEELERIRFLELKRKRAQAQPASTAAPEQPAEEPGITDYLMQLPKATAKGMMDMTRIPGAIIDLQAKGIAKAQEFITGEEPEWAKKLEPTPTSLQDLPAAEELVETVSGRTIPQGESALADAIYTFGEWAGPGTLMTAPLKMGAKKLPAMLVSKPDIAVGTGAAAGEFVGGETGEVIGGLTAAFAPSVNNLYRFIKPKKPATSTEQKALEIIEQTASNPAQAKKNLEAALARGEQGTLADLTKDPGIYNLESGVVKGTEGRRALDEAIEGREAQIVGDVEDIFPRADIEDAQDVAKQAVETRKETISKAVQAEEAKAAAQTDEALAASEARVAQADESVLAADEAVRVTEDAAANVRARETAAKEAIQPTEKAADVSAALRTRYDELEEAINTDIVKPAFRAFEESAPVQVKELKAAISSGLDDLPPAEAQDLASKYSTVFKNVEGWADTAKPADVQYVLSKIKDITNQAKNTGTFGTLERDLSIFSRQIEDVLRTGNRTEFDAAIEAYKMQKARTAPGKLGKARLKDEPETFMKRLNWAGEDGAATLRLLQQADDPQVMGLAEEYIRNLAKSEGVDAKFMEKYADVLEGFPQLRAQIADAADATELGKITDQSLDVAEREAMRTEKAATRATATETTKQRSLAKALEAQEKKIGTRGKALTRTMAQRTLSKYAESPNKTLTSLVKNPDGAPELKRLLNAVEQQGGGEALRAHAGKVLADIVAPLEAGRRVPTAKSIDQFIKARTTLVDSGVITADEADSILRTLDRTKSAEMRKKAALQRLDMDSEWDNLMSSLSASFLTKLMQSPSLIFEAAVRRNLSNLIQNIRYNQKVATQIEDFMANPAKYAEFVEPVDNPQIYADRLIRAIVGASQAEATEAGEE